MTLTDAQYNALLTLYHECNDAFWTLSHDWRQAFFNRLYGHDLPKEN